MKKTVWFPALLALATFAVTVVAQPAWATHPRPKGATPIRVPFVPAFRQCTAPNRTHGAPLAFPSCNPPVQTSSHLTIGSPDANGAGANALGYALISVKSTSPEDVNLSGQATDIRCRSGVAACGSANAADGPDYTGEVQSTGMIRISDHYNGPGLNEAGTVQDIPFPTTVPCTATASTSVGSTCAINTTANAVVPGAVKDTQRGVVEVNQIQAFDGGADGLVSTPADNELFAVQGLFIP
jgi:hypothetical protein